MSASAVITQICETGVHLGDTGVLLLSSHNTNQKKINLNTIGIFLPSYFQSFLLHKEAEAQGPGFTFFFHMFSASQCTWWEGQRASMRGSRVCFECVTPGNSVTDL